MSLDRDKVIMKSAWSTQVSEFARAIAFSRDGQFFAVSDAGGILTLFDALTGKTHGQWRAHDAGITAMAWHPMQAIFATCGEDGFTRIWALDGTEVAALKADAPWCEDLAWSPNGRHIATASGKIARIWTATGALLGATSAQNSTITGLAWNSKSTRLATACYGGVRVWNIKTMQPAKHLEWKGSFFKPHWSPDDAVIASGCQDNSVHFWRMSTDKDSEMKGYPSRPDLLAWDKDSTLLATGGGREILVWKFSGRGPENTSPYSLAVHSDLVSALAFHPRSRTLASGAKDGSVVLWQPAKKEVPDAIAVLPDAVSGLAWHPEGQLLAGCDARGKVEVWKARPDATKIHIPTIDSTTLPRP